MEMGTGLVHKDQRGFTLIELLVAIALAGIITGGITAAIMQVLNINHRASNHMICVRQVQQAGKEVNKDTLQAQNVTCPDNPGFLLTFVWTDWGGTVNEVTYEITGDNELERTHKLDGVLGGARVIAQYIDDTIDLGTGKAKTRCEWDPAKKLLTFTVTAAVGTESETRVYEIEPRPG
jgi:prepilin-type N-terminal cleavage/methylation domain-containing protein